MSVSILSGFDLKVWGDIMRVLVIGFAAAFLMLPASAPAKACEGYAASAQATATELSAAETKDGKDAAKPMKKTAMKKKSKAKVEYMRAAPMPPGAK
jgi:hypothetical protein